MTVSWLVYRSHPSISPWPTAILDIVRSCERNNPQLGVNGFMLYSDEFYLQCIEGKKSKIDALGRVISADDRHRVDWAVEGEGAPLFSGLPMGYFDAEREQPTDKNMKLWGERGRWQADQAGDLRDMMEKLAREKYPSALKSGA